MLHFIFFIFAISLGVVLYLKELPILAGLLIVGDIIYFLLLFQSRSIFVRQQNIFTSFFSNDLFQSMGSIQEILKFRKNLLANFKNLQDYQVVVLKDDNQVATFPQQNIEYTLSLREALEYIYQKSLYKIFLIKNQNSILPFQKKHTRCYACSYNIPIINSRIIIFVYYYMFIPIEPEFQSKIKVLNDVMVVLVFMSEFSRKNNDIIELLQEVVWMSPYAIALSDPSGELVLGNNALYQLFYGNIPNFRELAEPEVFLLLLEGKRIGKTFVIRGRQVHFEAYPISNKNFLITKCLFIFYDEHVETRNEQLRESSSLRRFTSGDSVRGAAMFTIEGTLLYSNEAFMKNLYVFKVREAKQKTIFDLFKITEEKFREIIISVSETHEYMTSLFGLEKEYEFNVLFKSLIFGDQTILEVILQDEFLYPEHQSYLDKETQGLYEELKTARSVQEHILSLPTIYRPGVAVDTLYVPSRQLSGDFFTVVPFENDQMGFIIADVSGHGVSASLITAALKILVKFAPSDSNNLPKIISYFNTYLADILPEGSFVTLFYGIVDFEDYTFRYINCGHPFPILEDLELGETKILEGMGFPLGGLLNVSFDEHIRIIQLPHKAKLLFYTDGVFQHLSGTMKDKMEKICNAFVQHKAVNDKNLLKKVYHNLVDRNSSFPEDDVSLMMVSLDKTCTEKHHMYISSTLIEADEAVKEICTYIQKKAGVESGLYWRIHTSFYEAMLNAIVHGNKYNTQKKVYIDFRITESVIVIRIRDEGKGFNFNTVANPLDSANILKEFGRGITMIKTLADKVKFNRLGNELTLFFYKSGRKK
ncbi:MAG: ATP-binding SpoIIE family protein phosphatase [Brevinemataceae bacterium]